MGGNEVSVLGNAEVNCHPRTWGRLLGRGHRAHPVLSCPVLSCPAPPSPALGCVAGLLAGGRSRTPFPVAQRGAVQPQFGPALVRRWERAGSGGRGHEAARRGAAEGAVCVRDRGEGGAVGQAGAPGRPYLWARLDRKPNKQAEKRFKRFLYSLEDCKEFVWNIEEDFKPVPDTWIPAKDIEFSNGNPLPDENGHMPGWVPVEKNSKQYCWHSSVINYEAEIALVLKHHADPGLLEISPVPLSEILEQTLELIGTNINANPYGLGSKKQPVHLLVPHGAFELKNPPALKQNDILSWFEGCSEGKVEGIVWHCHDGCLIKLHRHHLGLPWPLAETYLSSQPVVISFNRTKYDCDFEPKSLFHHFSNLDGQRFDRLKDIKFDV
ncbi:RNA ligase 1 isoform X2 [Columba livia]|uniref:RNA ligase 1 isoform X2 n=1 Tax=Columba livia TaxID=8932 RepID=UPI0031B9FA9F